MASEISPPTALLTVAQSRILLMMQPWALLHHKPGYHQQCISYRNHSESVRNKHSPNASSVAVRMVTLNL